MAYFQNQLFWPPKPRQMVHIVLPDIHLLPVASGQRGIYNGTSRSRRPGYFEIPLPQQIAVPQPNPSGVGVNNGYWPVYKNGMSTPYLRDGINLVITDIHIEMLDNPYHIPVSLWKYSEHSVQNFALPSGGWVSGVLTSGTRRGSGIVYNTPLQLLYQTRTGTDASGTLWLKRTVDSVPIEYHSSVGINIYGNGNYLGGSVSGTRIKLLFRAESPLVRSQSGIPNLVNGESPRFSAILTGYYTT